MHKRGRCRQYILISGQQTVSDAGWHTCHVNASVRVSSLTLPHVTPCKGRFNL